MIKFFQKLKAKKGFTLVELIVVIAIIGVLAAILIPTMMGYVTSSQVTSKNTTASNIKNNVDNFLTTADTSGYGMLKNGKTVVLDVVVDGSGTEPTWTVKANHSDANAASASDYLATFKKTSTISWNATGAVACTLTGSSATKKGTLTNATDILAFEIGSLFPEIKSGCGQFVLKDGKCIGVWFTTDNNIIGASGVVNYPAVSNFTSGSYKWNDSTAGVTSDGYILGTAPALIIGNS